MKTYIRGKGVQGPIVSGRRTEKVSTISREVVEEGGGGQVRGETATKLALLKRGYRSELVPERQIKKKWNGGAIDERAQWPSIFPMGVQIHGLK